MSAPLEEYALIGDMRTAALVSREGSIDWLCLPRFDSPACFAKLLGGDDHGKWQIAPCEGRHTTSRRYQGDTLILETEFKTGSGTALLVDFMPVGHTENRTDLIRLVYGLRGKVELRSELILRFGYGKIVPWVTRHRSGIMAIAAPHTLVMQTPIEMKGEHLRTIGRFTVEQGAMVPFSLVRFRSYDEEPEPLDPVAALEQTRRWWESWVARCRYEGQWRETVVRSLIVVKALSFSPSGGIIAAPTTSLPEVPGKSRNWDYRFCWPRDATFTFYALEICGYRMEAAAWRQWLYRAVAGHPSQMQTVYGVGGERIIFESELEWLPGYEQSRPVHIGNAAHQQFQLDVFGEIMDSLYVARRCGLPDSAESWPLENKIARFIEDAWRKPDNGIWELRGDRCHYTHSKMMAWVALDRAVRTIEQFGARGPLARWRSVRDFIHREICERGFNTKRNAFVQCYDSDALDAALVLMPLVGFLPPNDPRVRGTVKAIQRELSCRGLIFRYAENPTSQRPAPEGAFLPCSLWLADTLELMGRHDEALALFERVRALSNDVGLLAEEYDPERECLIGNFPQALSHVSLINTAHNLVRENGPASHRASTGF